MPLDCLYKVKISSVFSKALLYEFPPHLNLSSWYTLVCDLPGYRVFWYFAKLDLLLLYFMKWQYNSNVLYFHHCLFAAHIMLLLLCVILVSQYLISSIYSIFSLILIFFIIVKLVDGGSCAIKSYVEHEHTVKRSHHQTLTNQKLLHCFAALSEIDSYLCTDVTMSFSVI